MKKFLLAALFAAASMLSFAEIIQYEGVYYDVSIDGSTGYGRVVAPPEGSYSGDVAVYSKFTLDGVTYSISNSISLSQGFKNPTIKNFTCGFNTADFGGRSYNISLRNNKGLESIKFLHLDNVFQDGSLMFNNVNLGSYNTDCVKVTMRSNGDENLLAVEKFNVYGPDGKLLKPRLVVEMTGELIAPDENNVFHLDSEWKYKGQYCVVLPLKTSDYTVVCLFGVGEDNKAASVRVEPLKGETGVYTQCDGITYSINGDHAELGTNKNSGVTTGDVVIPEYVEFAGRQYPVTTIHPDAFAGSEITSVTVPSSVTELAPYAFSDCSKLEFADLSKTSVTQLELTFYRCENLKEVKLPQPAKVGVSAKAAEDGQTPLTLNGTFNYCSALESIRLPYGTVLKDPFTGSGVADFEVADINECKVAFRCNKFNVFDEDGQVLPFKLYVRQHNYDEDITVFHTPTFVNGLYEFKYEDFFYTSYNGSKQFNGAINCDFDETASNAIGGGSYLTLSVKKNEFSGVTNVEVDDNVPAVYYNLQGLRVPTDNLTPGIYIERRGKKATKVLIK